MELDRETESRASTTSELPTVKLEGGPRFELVDVSGEAEVSDGDDFYPHGPIIYGSYRLFHFPSDWKEEAGNEQEMREVFSVFKKARGRKRRKIRKVLSAMHEETETVKRSREQFLAMLFDSGSSVRPGGYHELLRLEERLERQEERIFPDLVASAEDAARFPNESHPAARRLARDYWAVQDRQDVLQTVLERFEINGKKPSEWEILERLRRRDDRSDFNGRDETRARAGDVIEVYHKYENDIERRSDLEKKLEQEGYEKGENIVRAVQRALKRDWENGSVEDFVRQLGIALGQRTPSDT